MLQTGDRVEVRFAANRGVRYEPGEVRGVHKDADVIRAVLVRLDNGKVCVVSTRGLRVPMVLA